MKSNYIKTITPSVNSESFFEYEQVCAFLGDSFAVLKQFKDESLHAVVTDPPYGVKEFDSDQIEKMENGQGGVWRIPPSFDGCQRSPLPRFTALNKKERQRVYDFFFEFSLLLNKKLLPGAHVFLASNTFLSQLVYSGVIAGGLEFRGEIIRLVQTLRGGDRPKNAEKEFSGVCSMPKGTFEPWGLFRKTLPDKMTVAEALRQFKTGGLRRKFDGSPFSDVIKSERTPSIERDIANHPSIKPQSFLREIVYAALPLGEGVILDPFMGSGSTLAACNFNNYSGIGIEISNKYFEISRKAIPVLSKSKISYSSSDDKSCELELFASGSI